ncbi:MAG: 16S rRNA (cytosine(1402)-N(4))-methyltransferase RsmH [Candidatus Neoclostridium sp.]
MEQYHVPVMFEECMTALNVKPDGVYFDGTLGGGSHTAGILARGGRVVATDRDDDAIEYCKRKFANHPFKENLTIVKSNFKDFSSVISRLGIKKVDGVLLDLGISSHQVDDAERGFSFRQDAPLDMRMDRTQRFSAFDIVNDWSQERIAEVILEYGEEKFARRIARNVCSYRQNKKIETTLELADIVKHSVDSAAMKNGHPAKKTFQALRIAVNDELGGLGEAIGTMVGKLNEGGRIAIISFHSLEDRIVKRKFTELSTGCICDKSLPICVCGHKADLKLIGKYRPKDKELLENSRSASATLRVAEKIDN